MYSRVSSGSDSFYLYVEDGNGNVNYTKDVYKVGTETLNLFQWSGWRPKTHSHCGINCKYSDRVAETCEACDRGRTCGDSSFLYYGDGVYAEDA